MRPIWRPLSIIEGSPFSDLLNSSKLIILLITLVPIFSAICSGMLLCVGFPPFNWSVLTWFALIPLLLFTAGKSEKRGFLLSYICGIVFFLCIFNWILVIPKYTLLHHGILAVYLGSFFAVFGLAFTFVSRRWGLGPAFSSAPFIWVSLEYIRANLSFLALPWGLLAHSQHQNATIIQISSITGAYGVSFLIVAVNSAFAALVYPVFRYSRETRQKDYSFSTKHARVALGITAALLVIIVLFYGHITIRRPINGKRVKVSVVQGNIEQKRKWDPKYAEFIIKTYAELTKQAAKSQPALIVWPETATPRSISRDPWLFVHVNRIANEAGAYLLLGSAQHQKFKQDASDNKIKYLNSAFLIPPEKLKSLKQRYDKVQLFPFGEYLPLRGVLPWSYINVPDRGNYIPGEEFTVFQHPDFRFGVTICWENIFPDLVRQFVKRGAQAIINITNEAWFGKTAAPYQFVAMSVFRAVENRVFVVRCANTGISCIIDPYGRIIDRVKDDKGRDIFVQGVLTGSIVPLVSKTFYTQYGDWLAWVTFMCSAFFLAYSIMRRKSNQVD